ncbi:MAG: glycosyl hydrolase family 28-related protein, partial [Kiritimatiellae bacterium]|nr:glycosyl hydrolase family 28-related protein [Kiritimatiellia bacterium]
EVTLPDETLVITGDRLNDASLRVWMEGHVEDLLPLRTAKNRMQAVVPKDWPLSTMLVWPVHGESIGTPIRVNGATLWWAWPARLSADAKGKRAYVRLMGKNLKLGRKGPQVWLKGTGTSQRLSVVSAHEYQVVVAMPRLPAGNYELFVHNGTGGPYGWSESARVEIAASPVSQDLPEFEVDHFGAKRNDGLDDATAIQQAVDAAVKAGGGRVKFGTGTYHLSRTITLPNVAGCAIHLVGTGMGRFDAVTLTTKGRCTVLTSLSGTPSPKCLIQIDNRFSSICNLTLICGHEGILRAIHDRAAASQVLVRITQHDVTVERVRFVMPDVRPDLPPDKRQDLQIYDAALHINAPGQADIWVNDCEFYSAGSGIEIGTLQRGHTDDGMPDPSTDYVCVGHSIFRGYSRGFYKEPAHPGSYGHMGIFNEGIQVPNGKNVIIQGCDFAGADRRGGKMMNRSICVYNTSTRCFYIADNHSYDVGMTCPRQDRVVNQSEQILFHFRYPHGGYFDVLDAGTDRVAVNPADLRNAGKVKSPHHGFDRAGSRVLEEVGMNDHWLVFVSAGKGIGQWRVVTGTERTPQRVVLKLDRPWRVVPDTSSRITLNAAFRQNIMFRNSIDAGFIDPRAKVAGILFWYNAFDNIIAGSKLKNLGYGIGFNASFRNPCCWNLVRDNSVENVGGMSVECREPTFYFDTAGTAGGVTGPLYRAGSDLAGWYAVGNVARSNRGQDGPAAAFIHAVADDASSKKLPAQEDAGVIMPVVENSRFIGVKRGIVINRGTIWPVLRGNEIQTVDPATPEILDQSQPAK